MPDLAQRFEAFRDRAEDSGWNDAGAALWALVHPIFRDELRDQVERALLLNDLAKSEMLICAVAASFTSDAGEGPHG